MIRSVTSALLIVLGALAFAPAFTPALAQFDTIFGNSNRPPRPPADVPGRPQAEAPPPSNNGLLPPGPPPNSTYTVPRPGGVQSQPLPPPPGIATAPPRAPVNVQPPAAGQAPPGQRPPVAAPGTPPPASNPPAANAPPAAAPPDEAVIEPPAQKIPNPTAVFAGLDKITGRITTFDVQINETVRFGALEVTPRACFTRPPTETQNTDGFVEVDEVTLQGELKRIFTGWMFAASPGLNAVEHPIYDVWLTDCKGATSPVTAEVAPETPPPAPQRPQRPAPPPRRTPTQQQTQQLPPPPAPAR